MEPRAPRAATPSRMLGLDVGERRIGVAVSEGTIAVPLTIISHTNRQDDIASILRIAEEERAAAIVIGMPYAPDGGEGAQARLTRRFGADLAARTDLPIHFEDERLSSADVSSSGGFQPAKRRRKTHIDDRAAAIILQRFIDARART